MTIFNWLDQILVHKKSWDTFSDEDKKSFSTFIKAMNDSYGLSYGLKYL